MGRGGDRSGALKQSMVCIAIGLQMWPVAGSQAATINVDTTLDDDSDCSLREALTSIENGSLEDGCVLTEGIFGTDDAVIINPGLGTLLLETGFLNIGFPVDLQGNGNTLDDQTGGGQLLRVTAGAGVAPLEPVIINNLNFTGGTLDIRNRNAELNQISVSEVEAPATAAVIFSDTVSSLSNSKVYGNAINQRGAVTVFYNASLTISNTQIYDNSYASFSGGSGLYANGVNTEILIQDSTITNHKAQRGGGIHIRSCRSVSLINSTISENMVSQGGGGVYSIATSSCNLHLMESTVSANSTNTNSTANSGGGIFWQGSGSLVVENSKLLNNFSRYGGGIRADGHTTIRASTIDGNSATVRGGGLRGASTVNVYQSTISNNYGRSFGGGVLIDAGGQFSAENTTISQNFSYTGGGFNLLGNSSDPARLMLKNSTVAFNTASFGGGIDSFANSAAPNEILLTNSIISNSVLNPSFGDTNLDCSDRSYPTIITNTNSIIADGSCEQDNALGDPRLGPLDDNGGLTMTHLPDQRSSLIDACDNDACPLMDQRMEERTDGDCDIGAVEVEKQDSTFFVIPIPSQSKTVIINL